MKALVIIDMQNDFLEGGALEVPKSNKIIPIINEIQKKFKLKIFTQDWHPVNHKSFASNHPQYNLYDVIDLNGIQQVLWPDHCVQITFGAEIHKDVSFPNNAHIIRKGMDPNVDSYSGFFDNGRVHSTGLELFLKEKNVKDIYICGLATDYCVKYTAIDSAELNFKTYLVVDATQAVNINPDDFDKAVNEMENKGIIIIHSKNIFN